MGNKKFIAETKDVRLTVKRADTFGVSFVNCEQDILRVEEAQNVIRLIQTKKVSASNWLRWFTQGMPEIVVGLPHDVEVCEVESDSNQVLITDIEIGKLYVEVGNGKVEVVNLKADDVFLKCCNGSASATNVEVTHVCTLDTLSRITLSMRLRCILGLLKRMKSISAPDSVWSSAQDVNVKRCTHFAPRR